MKSHQDIRQRAGALLLTAAAASMISAVVPPASAASEPPAAECPASAQEAVAALDAKTQTLIARARPMRAAVEARLAEKVDLWHDAQARQLGVIWQEAEVAELDVAWRESEAVGLEVAVRDIVTIEGLRAVAVLDRGLDTLEQPRWAQEWSGSTEKKASARPHPISTGIDVLVSLVRVPARAALAVRHLVEAFAKVTPRVVRVLL